MIGDVRESTEGGGGTATPAPQAGKSGLAALRGLEVADLMTRRVVTLEPDDNLAVVDDLMQLGHFRHIPVTEHGRLVGLITHRDLLRALGEAFGGYSERDNRWFGKGRIKRSIRARDVMTGDPLAVGPHESVGRAAEMLRANMYGCLPVVEEDGDLVGIVTEADFLDLVVRALDLDAKR